MKIFENFFSLTVISWFWQRMFCSDGSKRGLITKAAFPTLSPNFTVHENIFLVAVICVLRYRYVGAIERVEGFTDFVVFMQ